MDIRFEEFGPIRIVKNLPECDLLANPPPLAGGKGVCVPILRLSRTRPGLGHQEVGGTQLYPRGTHPRSKGRDSCQDYA